MMLAENVDQWTDEYNDAMGNKTLLFGQVTSNNGTNIVNYNARLHYDDIVREEADGGIGDVFNFSYIKSKIVVPTLPDLAS